jgi:DNA-binding MarR family transcriptional regulator
VEREGVTVAEWVFLRVLYDAEGRAPSDVAERLGMTKGAISKLAHRLLDKALVQREANRDDLRAHSLALTPEGRALVPKLARRADANDASFFAALSADEQRRLARLLRKLAGAHALTSVPID